MHEYHNLHKIQNYSQMGARIRAQKSDSYIANKCKLNSNLNLNLRI